MATKPKEAETTAVANYDDAWAKAGATAAAQEAHSGGGTFISLKSGIMSVGGRAMPDNQLAAIIIDNVLENVFYDGAFDSDNPSPPKCFAFGRANENGTGGMDDMTPHLSVVQNGTAQHETCKGCPKNEWGTAVNSAGKPTAGKACKNIRRLALIAAGEFNPKTGLFEPCLDPEHYATTETYYLKVSVTSVKNFSAFVKGLWGSHKRPPFGAFVKISLHPHMSNQTELKFTPLDLVPNEIAAAVFARNEQEMALTEFPYQLGDGTAAKKAPVKPTGKKYTR